MYYNGFERFAQVPVSGCSSGALHPPTGLPCAYIIAPAHVLGMAEL